MQQLRVYTLNYCARFQETAVSLFSLNKLQLLPESSDGRKFHLGHYWGTTLNVCSSIDSESSWVQSRQTLLYSGSEFSSNMSHSMHLENSISSKCSPAATVKVLFQSSLQVPPPLYKLTQETQRHKQSETFGKAPLVSSSFWSLFQTGHWGCVHGLEVRGFAGQMPSLSPWVSTRRKHCSTWYPASLGHLPSGLPEALTAPGVQGNSRIQQIS